MPVGKLKNALYAAALPVLGQKCAWRSDGDPVSAVYHKHYTQGACYVSFTAWQPSVPRCVGFGRLESKTPVTPDTVFRTASLTKTVVALLVMRLQTKGLLSVQEDLSAFWPVPVRNPIAPDVPITLGMLLSHTSSLCDSPLYFRSYSQPVAASDILADPAVWQNERPGTAFHYSNFAAGFIASLLEQRFGETLESLAQRELFAPLGVTASFQLAALSNAPGADDYRVLPKAKCFDFAKRAAQAQPRLQPDPEHAYLQAAGCLLITAPQLARLITEALNPVNAFLDEASRACLMTPVLGWPDQTVIMKHGMGLFYLNDQHVLSAPVYGHQGFAYGAVNGIFFTPSGDGFVSLTNGCSERRIGHLSCLHRDLLRVRFPS